MKKNLSLAIILFLGLFVFVSSCKKDTFTEQDAYAQQRQSDLLKDSLAKAQAASAANLSKQQILLLDSLKKVGGVINYSVDVVVASKSSWWSNYFSYSSKGEQGEMGLDGAVVTLSQYGRVYAVTTTASGIASFTDLRIGTANVNISKTGYTEVDYIVDLPPLTSGSHTSTYDTESGSATVSDTATQNVVDIVRNGATMVPVFSLTTNLSTVSGKATVETDLTNDAPEVAAGVKIMGIIDVNNSDFWQLYMYQPELYDYWYGPTGTVPKFDYYGKIKQIAFGSTISTATTAADGTFTMQVPSTPQGLPIDFEVDQFALNQTLLMPAIYGVPVWGVQTVRTMFGTGISYSPIPNLGLGQMNVQSAYVQFSAPTGSPAAQPTTTAAATAVLESSGIVSFNITNQGSGYTQPPYVKIAKGTAFNSVQAEATAVITNGKVTGLTITNAGSGYLPADNPTVTFFEGVPMTASYTPEFTFSVVDITFSAGTGYGSTAPAVTILGTGTGATAHAVMAADIKSIDVTNPGSGYTQAPQITIADNFKAWDQASAVMTVNNPLFSIDYSGLNVALWATSPAPTATIVGDGAGATASVTLSTSGKVTGVTAIVAGSGYTSAPIVTISGGGGFGATAHAVLLGTAVNSVVIDDPGQGYTSIPSITFSGGAGAGAGATATIGFPVQSITMTAPGVGYNSVTAINVTDGTTTVNYFGNCVVKYNKGVRSITFTNTPGFVYSAVPVVTITPRDANGTGAAATATVNWSIADIVVDAQGSGYKMNNDNNLVVKIDAPGGSGTQATATAVPGNGKLTTVKIGSQGEGYTAAPNVYLNVIAGAIPTKQAKLTATVTAGHVTGLTIVDPGEGYDYANYNANNYAIVISTYNSGAAATVHANPSSGKIAFIQISNPGAGYSVAPKVEIYNDTPADANGFGTGAVATAVVTDGRVSAINLTNAGSGYYVAPNVRIVVVSSVIKAMGRCIVSSDGRITGVDFTNPGGGWPGYQFTSGFGYDTAPTVTFVPSVAGKGTGAIGIATINNGSVSSVIMTNQGSGYTGRNKPLQMGFSMTPGNNIYATAGKSYVMDFYFGTGMHTVTEQGIF